jgi:hypothetical protein
MVCNSLHDRDTTSYGSIRVLPDVCHIKKYVISYEKYWIVIGGRPAINVILYY